MISGLWSNSNYDDGKNTRRDALLNIEKMFNDTIYLIYNGVNRDEEADQKMHNDPFFAAIKLAGIDEPTTPSP